MKTMKRIYIIILLIAVSLVLTGVLVVLSPLLGRGRGEVDQGAAMLTEARQLYAEGRYEACRDSIVSLRRRFPTALEARRQAILLMDSVELQLALAEGDTLRTEFYRRKLEHDVKGLRD